MRKILIFILSFTILSCIPIKVAPRFKKKDYTVVVAKKFQRKLQRETSFIFKDPKDAGDFYDFINAKYNLDHKNVGFNVPFQLEDDTFYLTYHEVERIDKSIILPFLLIDAKRTVEGKSTYFDEGYSHRKGHWYIILTVYDESINNTLLNNYPLRNEIIQYLKELKAQYLTFENYEELQLIKKS